MRADILLFSAVRFLCRATIAQAAHARQASHVVCLGKRVGKHACRGPSQPFYMRICLCIPPSKSMLSGPNLDWNCVLVCCQSLGHHYLPRQRGRLFCLIRPNFAKSCCWSLLFCGANRYVSAHQPQIGTFITGVCVWRVIFCCGHFGGPIEAHISYFLNSNQFMEIIRSALEYRAKSKMRLICQFRR